MSPALANEVRTLISKGTAPRIMGILNVTPDSFSDGGKFLALDSALGHARRMCEEGAHMIDVGGESTRPGAEPVSISEELDRVIPVVEEIRKQCDVQISIDTSKAQVMTEAVRVGAGFINDIRALREDGALDTAAGLNVPVCLMHMQGDPKSMQNHPHYDDVTRDVGLFLEKRAQACEQAGIAREDIFIDPGFGFGKTFAHNMTLMARLQVMVKQVGRPFLVGLSRKSMIGKMVTNAQDRMVGSVGLAMLAAIKGASILRVHDVRPTADAIGVLKSVWKYEEICGLYEEFSQ